MNLLILPQEPEILPINGKLINLGKIQMQADCLTVKKEDEDIILTLRGKEFLLNGKEVKVETM